MANMYECKKKASGGGDLPNELLFKMRMRRSISGTANLLYNVSIAPEIYTQYKTFKIANYGNISSLSLMTLNSAEVYSNLAPNISSLEMYGDLVFSK